MSNFIKLKEAVTEQLRSMEDHGLLVVDMPDKDTLWTHYLASFPAGTNPIFRKRREHDCSCCKQFIRAIGNAVSIVNNQIVTIWDVDVDDDTYQHVADKMAEFVRKFEVSGKFLYFQKHVGTDHNRENDDGTILRWDHFHHELDSAFVCKDNIDRNRGDFKTSVQTFDRALRELSSESVEVVLELIDQNSLYRGNEYQRNLERFLRHKTKFDQLTDQAQKLYIWEKHDANVARIRNSAIGTLLVDLNKGMELDQAVTRYENVVAPANYKRPTALITQGMINKAQEKVEELGIEQSLHRRYAHLDDITINNVIYADRSVKKAMNVFDELSNEIATDPKKFDKVEEITIDKFIDGVLPHAESIELMFENRHENNLVSLIAPIVPDSPNILKWDNNFSWSYNGEVTDSIKERVRKAGGNVNAVLRCSLSWFNRDDLDIHVKEPDGSHIYYSRKKSRNGGELDVDMNVNDPVTDAVENIVWTNQGRMLEGEYQVYVHNYTKRDSHDVGFEVEIEYGGETTTFGYDKAVGPDKHVIVANFHYSKMNGITFKKSLPPSSATKELWNINTNGFHKVDSIMLSPNYWDGQEIGNKHWFFMLDNCKNSEKSRGFYNEFLSNELTENRKVFEVLGSKLKTEKSDHQLSGLGFSSTQRNSVICKVTGSIERVIKIKF